MLVFDCTSQRDGAHLGAARVAPQRRAVHAEQRRVLPGARDPAGPQGPARGRPAERRQPARRPQLGVAPAPVKTEARYSQFDRLLDQLISIGYAE